jgi:hypothetical protein
MRKKSLRSNLGSAALQKDTTSVLQVTRKQSPMRVRIRDIPRLRRPYSPDTRDDVQVLAKVVTLRERDRLTKNETGAKENCSVYGTLQI